MRYIVVGLLLLLAGIAGCLDDALEPDTSDDGNTDSVPADGPPGEPASGSPAEHGDPDVQEGPVTVQEPSPTGQPLWTASKTITIDNDFGGADRSDVGITFGPGDVHVTPSPDGDYHYTLTLIGRGGSEEEARSAVEDLEWGHDDALDGSTLVLDTWVQGPSTNGYSCSGVGPLTSCTGRSWSVDLVAQLPTPPAHDLDLDHGSADVTIDGLGGPALNVDVGSGDVALADLVFGAIDIDTGSGDITASETAASTIEAHSGSGDHVWSDTVADTVGLYAGSGDLAVDGRVGSLSADTGSGDQTYTMRGTDVRATAGSGDIELDFTPTGSGSLGLETSSGAVDVDLVPGAYDITADTGSGDIEIDVSGTQRVDDGDDESFAHYRTPGFTSASPATTIGIDTGSGDVTVQD